jgi:hypothetical protein
MKKTLIALAFLCLPFVSAAQNQPAPADFNLDFEKKNPGQKLPDKWMQWGTSYQVVTDSTEKHNGKNSVLLKAPDPIPNGTFGSVASTIPAVRPKSISSRYWLGRASYGQTIWSYLLTESHFTKHLSESLLRLSWTENLTKARMWFWIN